MEFHLRYTCSAELQCQIVDFITRNAKEYIICKEQANREHIHCYAVLDVTKKTWVNKFNLKFKGMDRRDKYVEPDKGNTKLYVCKGTGVGQYEILAKRGFTDEDIVNFNKQWWENNPKSNIVIEFSDSPQLPEPKPKKQAKPSFMKQVRLELEELYPEKDWTIDDKPIVFKRLMFMLGDGCRNLDHIIISRMTYGVLNSLIKDKKEWLEYWYKKAFGEYLYESVENDMSLDE